MWTIIFTLVLLPAAVFPLNKFICEHSTDSISCKSGYVITIRSGNFGRTSQIVCSNNKQTNCYSSGRTIGFLASKCNGRNVCQLTAESNVIGENPCPGVPKYLDIQYECDPLPTTTTTTTTTTTATPNVQSGGSPQVCHEYLVSGPHGIPDSKLTASSQWNNVSGDDHGPHRARLFTTALDYGNGTYLRGAWSAKTNDKNQYIQAELNSISVVRGVVTQGRNVNPKDNCCPQKVTGYRVKYSVDGVHWETVKGGSNKDMIFPGNTDQETVVTNLLPCPVVAKYIRLLPETWDSHVSLRFDAIGCPTSSAPYGKCPTGWIERPGSNQCYLITTNQSKGWDDARQACRLAQGDLVIIDSIQERDWLKQELNKVKATTAASNPLFQVWIGLQNRPRTDSKNYKWTDGSALNQAVLPWEANMPDNYAGIEHCGEFVNSRLNDVSCNSPINYVCEKKKYWNTAANHFTPAINTASVIVPTTPTTRVPSSVNINIPIPIGGNPMTVGLSTFYRGCNRASDCYRLPLGDYQSCTGCHDYLTCSPSGDFVRKCPARLNFDYNTQACIARSSTCLGP